jgi:flagellar protein FlbD
MIRLTQLSGEPFVLNADLIRFVEQRPDTFITLTSGDRVVVRESMDEVVLRAVQYQQSKYLLPPPRWPTGPGAAATRAGTPDPPT